MSCYTIITFLQLFCIGLVCFIQYTVLGYGDAFKLYGIKVPHIFVVFVDVTRVYVSVLFPSIKLLPPAVLIHVMNKNDS